ncbi:MAG: hypothetical protein P8J59_02185 [Phycisphaerales bacterium]|nr:hypothetical protein [Phycisphaerales bacterium]
MRPTARTTGIPSTIIWGLLTSILPSILAVVWITSISGCNMTKPTVKRFDAYPAIRDDLSPELAQLLLQDYSASATSVVDQAMEEILEVSDDPEMIDHALRFRAAAVSEIRRAALRVNPVAGALDSWVLLEQLRTFLFDGPGKTAFKGQMEIIDRMMARLDRDLDIAVERMLEDRELAEATVDSFADTHLISSLNLARPSVISPVANDDARLRTLMDSVASFDFLANAAYYRLGAAIDDLPQDLRWQSEIVIREVFADPRVAEAIKSLDELDGQMQNVGIAIEAIPTSLDENGEGIVKSIEFLSQKATDEVAVTVEEGVERIGEIAEAERLGAQRDIERQRLETIEVLQAEREVVLEAIAKERMALVEDLSRERDVTIKMLQDMIASQTDTAIEGAGNRAETAIDRAIGGMLLVVGVGLGGVIIVVVLMRFLRRPAMST